MMGGRTLLQEMTNVGLVVGKPQGDESWSGRRKRKRITHADEEGRGLRKKRSFRLKGREENPIRQLRSIGVKKGRPARRRKLRWVGPESCMKSKKEKKGRNYILNEGGARPVTNSDPSWMKKVGKVLEKKEKTAY